MKNDIIYFFSRSRAVFLGHGNNRTPQHQIAGRVIETSVLWALDKVPCKQWHSGGGGSPPGMVTPVQAQRGRRTGKLGTRAAGFSRGSVPPHEPLCKSRSGRDGPGHGGASGTRFNCTAVPQRPRCSPAPCLPGRPGTTRTMCDLNSAQRIRVTGPGGGRVAGWPEPRRYGAEGRLSCVRSTPKRTFGRCQSPQDWGFTTRGVQGSRLRKPQSRGWCPLAAGEGPAGHSTAQGIAWRGLAGPGDEPPLPSLQSARALASPS